MIRIRHLALGGLAVAACIMGAPMASATSLTVDWYTILPDSDFGPVICCNVYSNEVMPTLGPNGYPVLNPSHPGAPISDVNPITGELTWWNPTLNPNVTFTGTSTLTLPVNQNMYIPNGTGNNDANGFQGAILRGTLVVPTPENVQFNLGSDDDSFLAIGNNVVAQLGGVHGDSATTYTTALGAGTYALTLFYVDRQQTGASLQFSVLTTNVTLNPVPLPAGLPLLISGLGVLGFAVRRRRS